MPVAIAKKDKGKVTRLPQITSEANHGKCGKHAEGDSLVSIYDHNEDGRYGSNNNQGVNVIL
jgi:hypothetical protein